MNTAWVEDKVTNATLFEGCLFVICLLPYVSHYHRTSTSNSIWYPKWRQPILICLEGQLTTRRGEHVALLPSSVADPNLTSPGHGGPRCQHAAVSVQCKGGSQKKKKIPEWWVALYLFTKNQFSDNGLKTKGKILLYIWNWNASYVGHCCIVQLESYLKKQL